MRCFIAIDIDEKIKNALTDFQRKLRSEAGIRKSDAKWVNTDNIHLTLKFSGEVKDEKIAEVCGIVQNVSAGYDSFELGVESVGYFGQRGAKVLWVGTKSDGNKLSLLQNDLDQGLASAGWPAESGKFAGHLTLCRVRNSKAAIILAKMTEDYKDYKLGTILADSISVYQSQLTPKGPVYTVLGNYQLK